MRKKCMLPPSVLQPDHSQQKQSSPKGRNLKAQRANNRVQNSEIRLGSTHSGPTAAHHYRQSPEAKPSVRTRIVVQDSGFEIAVTEKKAVEGLTASSKCGYLFARSNARAKRTRILLKALQFTSIYGFGRCRWGEGRGNYGTKRVQQTRPAFLPSP